MPSWKSAFCFIYGQTSGFHLARLYIWKMIKTQNSGLWLKTKIVAHAKLNNWKWNWTFVQALGSTSMTADFENISHKQTFLSFRALGTRSFEITLKHVFQKWLLSAGTPWYNHSGTALNIANIIKKLKTWYIWDHP